MCILQSSLEQFFVFCVAAPLAVFFAFFVLYLNLNLAGIDAFAESNYFEGFPAIVDRFVNRILSNGDMYYLGLPTNVFHRIEAGSLALMPLYPFVGASFVSGLLGQDVANLSIGKQILLYHFPDHLVAGGPVSHYDLFLIYYFGDFFGLLGIPFLVVFIVFGYQVSRYARGNIVLSLLASSLIISSYSIILQPNIGLAYFFDVFVVFGLLMICAKLLAEGTRKNCHGSV